MKKRFTYLLVISLMGVLLFVGANAQSTKLAKSVIGSGGTVGESRNGLTLNSVTGQFVIESINSNTPGSKNYVLNQGFWIPDAKAAVSVNEGPTADNTLMNYPNPFSTSTTIEYVLQGSANVSIKIYDMSGNEIKSVYNGYQSVGSQKVIWDAKDNSGLNVNSGTYLYELQVNSSEIAGASKSFTLRNIMIVVK